MNSVPNSLFSAIFSKVTTEQIHDLQTRLLLGFLKILFRKTHYTIVYVLTKWDI